MSLHLLLLSLLVSLTIFSQEKRNPDYIGKIDSYPIELYIDSLDFIKGKVIAKYRYQNKKNYLKLTGEISNPVVYFEETFKGAVTGSWYLDIYKDSLLGRWIGNNKSLAMVLFRTENGKLLQKKCPQDFSTEVSEKKTGKYFTEYHFINDLFVNEEQLIPEIGFNGGSVEVQELGADSIYFSAELICGPTYHFAIAEGVALKKEQDYICKIEDNCEITLHFESKKLYIKANKSAIDCGFGARAYLDHELYKVSEEILMKE